MNDHARLANIDGNQRRFRFLNGIILGAIVAVGCWLIVAGDHPRWWLFLLFPCHLGAALGFFQARASTCVLLASRGSCHLGGQAAAVADPELREALRQRGRSITRRAFWTALGTTLLTWFLASRL
ncbi:MAG: hypothetical protein H6807_17860 [Planctomycetes bacterium]|nr:hypothetical protein [Planctomycetota bacterium]